VTAIDASPDGIEIATAAYPDVRFEAFSVYDDLSSLAPPQGWELVVASELVEHLYSPGSETRRQTHRDYPLPRICQEPDHKPHQQMGQAFFGRLGRGAHQVLFKKSTGKATPEIWFSTDQVYGCWETSLVLEIYGHHGS
jgi:hypothetical protein